MQGMSATRTPFDEVRSISLRTGNDKGRPVSVPPFSFRIPNVESKGVSEILTPYRYALKQCIPHTRCRPDPGLHEEGIWQYTTHPEIITMILSFVRIIDHVRYFFD